MRNFIDTLGFDEVTELEDGQATRQAVNDYFTNLATECTKHRDRKTGKKFLIVVFYSGHGCNHNATQRVTLEDDDNYMLEVKIRKHKNKFPTNTYTIGVFETCRSPLNGRDMVDEPI